MILKTSSRSFGSSWFRSQAHGNDWKESSIARPKTQERLVWATVLVVDLKFIETCNKLNAPPPPWRNRKWLALIIKKKCPWTGKATASEPSFVDAIVRWYSLCKSLWNISSASALDKMSIAGVRERERSLVRRPSDHDVFLVLFVIWSMVADKLAEMEKSQLRLLATFRHQSWVKFSDDEIQLNDSIKCTSPVQVFSCHARDVWNMSIAFGWFDSHVFSAQSFITQLQSLIPSYWQTYTQWMKAAVAVSRILRVEHVHCIWLIWLTCVFGAFIYHAVAISKASCIMHYMLVNSYVVGWWILI